MKTSVGGPNGQPPLLCPYFGGSSVNLTTPAQFFLRFPTGETSDGWPTAVILDAFADCGWTQDVFVGSAIYHLSCTLERPTPPLAHYWYLTITDEISSAVSEYVKSTGETPSGVYSATNPTVLPITIPISIAP